MSNLPITANTQQPGNTGNALQAGTPVDENGGRRYPPRSVGDGAKTQSPSAAKSTIRDSGSNLPESFADLLNRQVVISDPVTPIGKPIVANENTIQSGAESNTKEYLQDNLLASDAAIDASGMLAGMMQNFTAAQHKPSATGETQDTTPGGRTSGKTGRKMQEEASGETDAIPVLTTAETGRANTPAAEEAGANSNAATTLTSSLRVAGSQSTALSVSGDQGKRTGQVSVHGKSVPVDGTQNQQSLQGKLTQTSDKVGDQQIATRNVDVQPATIIAGAAAPTNDLIAKLEYADKAANLIIAKSGSASANPLTDATGAVVTRTNQNPLPVTLSIAAPFGNRDWSTELSQKITWMGDQKHQVAALHLNPPDLGPLDVVLKISGNQATAQFTSSHSAVREAVENAIPKLREMLADNGVMLGNTSVSDQAPQHGRGDGSMNQGTDANGTMGMRVSASLLPDTAVSNAPGAAARRHNGLVDTFA